MNNLINTNFSSNSKLKQGNSYQQQNDSQLKLQQQYSNQNKSQFKAIQQDLQQPNYPNSQQQYQQSSFSSQIRSPVQSHRQLVTSQTNKGVSPRSFDVKVSNIPNNSNGSMGAIPLNNSSYQVNQTVQIRPNSGTRGQTEMRMNSQEVDHSSELAYLSQNQSPQLQQKQQIQYQQQQNQGYQQQQQQIPISAVSPQKYLVQAFQFTESQENSNKYQQGNLQQQPSQSYSSANKNSDRIKFSSPQSKLEISQQPGLSINVGPFQNNSQINQQLQMLLSPLQNVSKILKLLDYLMQKNLFDDALDVCLEFVMNVINVNSNNTQTINAFSEHFHERNKLFQYASFFYSYLSNGETQSHPFQGGFVLSNNQNSNFSPAQSQYPPFTSNTSTIYQGNLNFGNPSLNFTGNANANNNTTNNNPNMTNISYVNSSYNLQYTPNQNGKINRKTDVNTMIDTFQICMEKIIEENEIYKQQYGIKYPLAMIIVFGQKMTYLNNLAVYNIKKHNYALAFEQFSVIEKYSRLSSSQQRNEHINQLTIQPSILNNTAISSILLEDWNQAENLLSKSIAQSEARVFPNMKNIEKKYLQEDQQFLSEIPVLAFGYIYAELVKRVKIQLKIPFSTFSTAADTFFIKNAVNIARKYFGQEHSFTRKVVSIQKLLDQIILYNQDGQGTQYSQQEDQDLFDSQPLGSSLPGINNTSTTNNNQTINMFNGLNQSSVNSLSCIYLILKECQFELNHSAINQCKKFIKFRRANFDKELQIWKQSIDNPNQFYNYYSVNQSSTRISTEPSQYIPIKKNFNSIQTSPQTQIHSSIDQQVQSDKINTQSQKKDYEKSGINGQDAQRSSNNSLQNQNSNRDQTPNGQNAYYLQGHHNGYLGNANHKQFQGSQTHRQTSRQKYNNSYSTNQQNNSNTNNTSRSHLSHRQHYQVNQQGEKSNIQQNNDNSIGRNEQKKTTNNIENSSQNKKQNNYPNNESQQYQIEQTEGYESEEHEQQDYEDSQTQRGEYNGYSKQNKQNRQKNQNKNNNQDDSNPNSKKIVAKRVQSQYFMKKPTINNDEESDQQQQQPETSQNSKQKKQPVEDNLKDMIIQVLNQNEQFKEDKQKSVQEINQLKTMLNSLIEVQKNSTQQLQLQQQQLIENQTQQLQKIEKQKSEPQGNNRQKTLAVSSHDNQPRSPFHSNQSPISPSVPILQLFNIFSDTQYESFSLSKQIYCGSSVPYIITSTLYKSGTLEIKAESQNQVIATEKIFKDQLKHLLVNLNYQPTLPASFSLNMCQNIYLFNKYFIMPFTSVDPAQKVILSYHIFNYIHISKQSIPIQYFLKNSNIQKCH